MFLGSNNSDDREPVRELFGQLQTQLPDLEELLNRCSDHWRYEDPVCGFYHQSWKVYDLQQQTVEIVEALQALAPSVRLNEWLMQIVKE